ncbi:ligand-binding sensor domain-containing protein [Sedimenticola hydrogenitrophicus]|uniref:ligand-binding sensor domain-containing protein n=1 Tax=Sedimenticola hydrogenitrophicus TaxID=2967975 RepID=UPI0023AF4197|nr:two-component regulator propeller domain-containing protein [Sedimenticola hydrogenitrophicus]
MKAMIRKGLIALVLTVASSGSFSQSSTPGGGDAAAPGQPATVPADGTVRSGFSRAASGVQFAHFRVGNRNVKAMLADGPLVWVGTSGGVIRYDTRSDQHRLYDVRSGLLSNGIFHLSKLGDRLLVGTYGGGLSILDEPTGTWENYNIQDGLADAFIYDVLTLDNGDIWIATWSGANRVRGGRLKDVGSWDTYTVENTQGGLPNDWVYGLAKGKNGEVWMATEGGLARFSEGAWSNWKHGQGLGAAYELVKDQIDFTRDPAKESSHHARQKAEMGLTNVDVAYNPNYIVSLLVDRQGAVWAGTWGGGLSRFDGTEWKTYTREDGLPSNHIFMLGHERNGRIWVGTSNGLARWDGEKFRVFTVHDGLYTNNIFSMANAPDGSLWIGGFGGVSRLIGLGSIE